ncbi:MAG: hypothetical protein HN952_03740 [Candidatus Cloacimonetes bacterium]|jgi:phosphate butyryltransferase|nr:hypothetical protein [Candidatus Cloacimonadota bacterium]MBT6994050.1 hypothetical protein [Candidatus Cloacimonadota bacterium]MBT7468852.1 hypothetical protein [Candidatus Cloacimonadota bacterium]
MPIHKLDDIIELVKSKSKKRIVIACGQDVRTIHVAKKAIDLKFAEITLVGNQNIIKKVCKQNEIDTNIFEIIHEPDEMQAAKISINIINDGKGDVLMKGMISTDKLLKCILDKQDGLMIPKAILTHISVAEIPAYHKLLIFSDAAIIPTPNINQKIDMTNYIIAAAQKIGIEKPKISLISFSEKTNPKNSASVDAAVISKMSERNQIINADIDGPLALDISIDSESLRTKGITSCVEGNADALIFPYLDVANVFFKSLTYFAKAEIATYIVGTKAPVIISSRVDSEKSKLYSMAFTCLMAE